MCKSRIDSYDGKNVTFHYNRHADDAYVEKCPKCGTTMLFVELYFNHKRVSLEELYEKAMSKARGKRSSA